MQQGAISSATIEAMAQHAMRPRQGAVAGLLRFIRKQPIGAASAAGLILIVLAAVFANQIAAEDPKVQVMSYRLSTPGTVRDDGFIYWFGTDGLGRDVLSRVVHGARVSLAVGVAAVSVGTIGGLFLGMFSGLRGGRLDMILQRVMDAKQSIPTLIFAMLLIAVLGTANWVIPFAIGIGQVPRANRIIRGNTLSGFAGKV